MNQNIGSINSFIRMIVGFSLLSFATARMARKPWKQSYLMLAMLGAMKVAEGFLHYCPIVALWERKNNWMDDAFNWDEEKINDALKNTNFEAGK
ncbi:YgaP family membrane protein [Jeotgalibacillus soli]|uniref:Inner membrane protein YgaP-like transmembrane domain-containing protein n=1 Tax=Jeotgalibacillus soli TaxID=889306 RepID=A0A0C2VUQ7_9BACL|nr:DUF2892 domain-containing protein [Jeotgalibacillus soli]KIL48161.1 hypothetical protein KP78_16080 [Jeotgalibacillus soli]